MVWSLSKLGSILIYPIDLFCQFGFTLMLWNTVLHLSAVFIALRTLYGNGLLFLWIIDIMVEGLALFFTHIISQTDARMVQAPHIDLRVDTLVLLLETMNGRTVTTTCG
ncbi:hypothetical protein BT96DRAFT_505313 [Gymnopus androsaceus JB14]|uniref:Uncharacterized protein n=1 Tax=Gymnopus androsaceus JB14 TaxID=1447944 RepID=A0A6A4I2M8_9AGAR|nr:hypothetical protein BT96DRAFT_505313 [Gymnopus androsaceus JB14]